MPSTNSSRAVLIAVMVATALASAPAVAQVPRVTINRIDVRSASELQLTLGARATDDQKKLFVDASAWAVESIDVTTGATRKLSVQSVTVDPSDFALTLQLAPVADEWLAMSTHTVSITFLRSANLARAVSAATPTNQGADTIGRRFIAAPTVAAANVYFSGKITATDKAKPRYSFEARVKDDWELPRNSGHFGYMAEVFADEATEADPDRISAGATYRRVVDPRPRATILHVQPIAGEFARKTPRTTTVLTTAHVEHVLVPTTGSARAKWAVAVYGGVEIGNNLSNALDKDNGSGAVTRVRVATNPFVIVKPPKVFKSLKGSAFWDVRFLANEEIDPGKLDTRGQPTLTRRTRQHVKIDIDFGFNDFVSLTIQHRYGYLPPVYKKVNPTISLGLTFKGKWA